MGRLSGKVAVVTGAAAGIGRATARLFAQEGAKVVILDHDEVTARETAEQMNSDVHGSVEAFTADVGVEEDLVAAADFVEQRLRQCHILVNNAGLRVYGPVTEMTPDDWDACHRVTLRGAGLASKHFLPLLARTGGGSIVNVSSANAWAGRPGMAVYDAMKAGLLALTRSMACDHAQHNIRVNAVLPGFTLTDFHRKRAEAAGRELDDSVTKPHEGGPGLLRRVGRPEEIAYSILFLASDESSFVTGAALAADGGSTAGTGPA